MLDVWIAVVLAIMLLDSRGPGMMCMLTFSPHMEMSLENSCQTKDRSDQTKHNCVDILWRHVAVNVETGQLTPKARYQGLLFLSQEGHSKLIT